MRILVFDTETTHLPPQMAKTTQNNLLNFNNFFKDTSTWSQYIDDWPHIIQLSYILYDTDKPHNKNAKIFNKYIEIPKSVKISKESTKIHHITRKTITTADEMNRAKIYDALKEFIEDCEIADVIVGHNVDFDRRMIIAELIRIQEYADEDDNEDEINIIDTIKNMMNHKHFKCTMEITKPICKLKQQYVYTRTSNTDTDEQKEYYRIKSPKLIEAYQYFFGYEPNPQLLHDAIIDAVICLRVFCITLPQAFDVCGTNQYITDYIIQISPNNYSCSSNNDANYMEPIIHIKKSSSNKSSRRISSSAKNSTVSRRSSTSTPIPTPIPIVKISNKSTSSGNSSNRSSTSNSSDSSNTSI